MRRVRGGWHSILGPFLALLAFGCNSDKTNTTGPTESIPPSQVTDLHIASTTSGGFVLAWSATGDDGDVGTASIYDLRYSTSPAQPWDRMVRLVGSPASQAPPTQITHPVTGLKPGTDYYFALKAGDESGNWSERSNDAAGTTDRRQVTPLSLGLVLISAPADSARFRMGSPRDELGRAGDEDSVLVTLTRSYWVCDHEVTQAEWSAVMDWNESSVKDPTRPVDRINWFDALEFCNRLSEQDGLTPVYSIAVLAREGVHITNVRADVGWNSAANGYRLLTEAEWEFACRAGAGTALSHGDLTSLTCDPADPMLNLEGWFCGNILFSSAPVKLKQPNAYGLYDMHGNAAEWCWDIYTFYSSVPVTNPTGGNPTGGDTDRVLRGGSFFLGAQACRSASRLHTSPGSLYDGYGLRIGRTVTP